MSAVLVLNPPPKDTRPTVRLTEADVAPDKLEAAGIVEEYPVTTMNRPSVDRVSKHSDDATPEATSGLFAPLPVVGIG